MRALALTASMMIASPVMAQTYTALDGPLPTTVILPDNWQMTPSDTDCMLVHRTTVGRPDMLIVSSRTRDVSVFGLLLTPNAPYTAALKLIVIAQGPVDGPIGRVTFTPTHDRSATFLSAMWPTANLMARLKTTTRLNFYRTDGRSVAAVSFGSGAIAAASFDGCLHGATATAAPPAPMPEGVDDLGWMSYSDRDGCVMVRTTRNGSELSLRYTRRGEAVAVYRMNNGPRYDQDEAVPVRFGFWQADGDNASIELANAALSVTMHNTNPGDGPRLVALGSNPLLGKLRLPGLSTLTIRSAPMAAGRIEDTVNVDGSAAMVADLVNCVRRLPK